MISLVVGILVLIYLALASVVLFLWLQMRKLGRDLAGLRQELAALRSAPLSEASSIRGPQAPPITPSGAQPLAPAAAGAVDPAATPVPVASPAAKTPGTPRSLEAAVGLRLSVWVGAIALGLAGVFLVKYAFDNDWLGPALRVSLGLLFGVALLLSGEWARRRRAAWIGSGLSAAGIAVLYAAFLAATNVYGLVLPVVGFGLMALTTALAVGLSLRQGPIVAVIGLVGGFLTPFLLRSETQGAALPLFLYLVILQYGLSVAARRSRWPWLPPLSLAASLGWVLLWLLGAFTPGDAAILYAFLAASMAGLLASGAAEQAAEEGAGPLVGHLLVYLGLVPALFLAMTVAGMAGFRPLDWLFLALLGAGSLALGGLRPAYAGLAWVAAGLTAVLLWLWYASALTPAAAPEAWFAPIVTGLGALYALGAYALVWRSPRPPQWAALSAVAGLAYFLVGCAWTLDAGLKLQSALLALALAGLYSLLAVPVWRWRTELPGGRTVLAALATAATAFISLAVPLGLTREWITVAWALQVPALIWLARRLDLPALRLLTWPLMVLVAFRLLFNPFILDYPLGATPLVNGLLYTYGLPLAAFALAAVWSQHDGDIWLSRILQGLAMAFGFAFLSLEVRHYFGGGSLAGRAGVRDLAEAATYSVVWLLYALGLLWLGRRIAAPLLSLGGAAVTALGLLAAILGSGLAFSPFFGAYHVGELPLVNGLLYIFGLPAALALLAGRELRRSAPLPAAAGYLVQATGLFLLWYLITALMRQAFHGPYLGGSGMGFAERNAYSLAWALYGLALLALGIRWRSKLLRYASLAVMVLTVAKVFLYDIGNVGGLYRVYSFLGLGASLFALAWLYQRFVFAGDAAVEPAEAAAEGKP